MEIAVCNWRRRSSLFGTKWWRRSTFGVGSYSTLRSSLSRRANIRHDRINSHKKKQKKNKKCIIPRFQTIRYSRQRQSALSFEFLSAERKVDPGKTASPTCWRIKRERTRKFCFPRRGSLESGSSCKFLIRYLTGRKNRENTSGHMTRTQSNVQLKAPDILHSQNFGKEYRASARPIIPCPLSLFLSLLSKESGFNISLVKCSLNLQSNQIFYNIRRDEHRGGRSARRILSSRSKSAVEH